MTDLDCFYCAQPATRRVLPARLKTTQEARADRNAPDPPPLCFVCDFHEDRAADLAMAEGLDGIVSLPLHESPTSALDRIQILWRWPLTDAPPIRAWRRWKRRRAQR